jgi:hypothetical protein
VSSIWEKLRIDSEDPNWMLSELSRFQVLGMINARDPGVALRL